MVLEKTMKHEYNQEKEKNEYRYIYPAWLDSVAQGLTKGAEKYPGETWKKIPADEHLARAMRHINLYRSGDRKEPHIINASMRMMMAFFMAEKENRQGAGESVHDIIKILPNGAEVHRYRDKDGAEISAIYSVDAHGRKDFYKSCYRQEEGLLVEKYMRDIEKKKRGIRSRVFIRKLPKGLELHRYFRGNDAYSAIVLKMRGEKTIEIRACKIDDEEKMLKEMGLKNADF